MRRLPYLLVLPFLVVSTSAQATLRRPDLPALSTGQSHDGTLSELWFSVMDEGKEVSYSLDLGVTVAQLRATNADAGNLSGLNTSGTNLVASFQKASDATRDYAFWIIDARGDSAWQQFNTAVGNLTNAVWAVMGVDAVGTSGAGQRGWIGTVQQGQEAAYRTNVTNSGINALQATTAAFVGTGLNTRPSHAVATDPSGDLESSIAFNGSSFDTKASNPDAYFGKVTAAYTNLSTPLMTNKVGQSAWFYDVTRSGSSNLGLATINEFDNLAGDAYWGFTAEAGNTGRYLLSYVLPRYLSPTEQASKLTYENSFARLAGVLSTGAAEGQASAVAGLTEGFLRRLAQRKQAQAVLPVDGLSQAQGLSLEASLDASVLLAQPVPEPSTWGLMGLGLAGLVWRTRRLQRTAIHRQA